MIQSVQFLPNNLLVDLKWTLCIISIAYFNYYTTECC